MRRPTTGRQCRRQDRSWLPREATTGRPGAPGRPVMVGDTGIEPVTSSVSRKRATPAPIAHPCCVACGVRGGDGIRTRVYGFAGRCLASRPLHREANEPAGVSPHADVASERTTGFEPATLTLAR